MEQLREDVFDMEEFLGYFLDEAQELIQQMDRDILQLEQSDASNLDFHLIDQMFRAAHTVKGSSGMVGLTEIPKISHRMEDILDKLRKNQISQSDELVDLLLESVDVAKRLVKEVSENKREISTVSEIISKIDAFFEKPADVEEEPSADVLQQEEIPQPTLQDNIILSDSEVINHEDYLAQQKSDSELNAEEYISNLTPFLTEYEEIRLMEAIKNQVNLYSVSFSISENEMHDATTNLLAELNNLGEVITVLPNQGKSGQMQFDIVLTTDYGIEQIQSSIKSQNVIIKPLSIKEESLPEKKVSPPEEEYAKDMLLTTPIEQIVRVKIQELDNLLNLVGELVINRSAIAQIGEEIFERMANDSKDLSKKIERLACRTWKTY